MTQVDASRQKLTPPHLQADFVLFRSRFCRFASRECVNSFFLYVRKLFFKLLFPLSLLFPFSSRMQNLVFFVRAQIVLQSAVSKSFACAHVVARARETRRYGSRVPVLPCLVFCVLCSVFCVLLSVFCALCSVSCVLCVLCSVFCVPCCVFYVLCSVLCVLCSVF